MIADDIEPFDSLEVSDEILELDTLEDLQDLEDDLPGMEVEKDMGHHQNEQQMSTAMDMMVDEHDYNATAKEMNTLEDHHDQALFSMFAQPPKQHEQPPPFPVINNNTTNSDPPTSNSTTTSGSPLVHKVSLDLSQTRGQARNHHRRASTEGCFDFLYEQQQKEQKKQLQHQEQGQRRQRSGSDVLLGPSEPAKQDPLNSMAHSFLKQEQFRLTKEMSSSSNSLNDEQTCHTSAPAPSSSVIQQTATATSFTMDPAPGSPSNLGTTMHTPVPAPAPIPVSLTRQQPHISSPNNVVILLDDDDDDDDDGKNNTKEASTFHNNNYKQVNNDEANDEQPSRLSKFLDSLLVMAEEQNNEIIQQQQQQQQMMYHHQTLFTNNDTHNTLTRGQRKRRHRHRRAVSEGPANMHFQLTEVLDNTTATTMMTQPLKTLMTPTLPSFNMGDLREDNALLLMGNH